MRPVPGFAGYFADDDGCIWSLKSGAMRPMKPNPSKGYMCLKVWVDGVRIGTRVHNLVALAFYGQPPDGMEVRHKDGNKANNHPSNLHYGTKSQNQMDRVEHGTSNRGERHGNAKLTPDVVLKMKADRSRGESFAIIGPRYGVTRGTASRVVNGQRWSHLR